MFLPYRAKNPPESLPVVTCGLIALNVIIYAATSNGLEIHRDIIQQWGLKDSHFDFPHVMSSMFLHGSIMHLLGNMWFLYLFGFAVEGRLRSLKFLAIYLLSGFIGDLLHHLIIGHAFPNMPSIGASGAIMGVMGAAMYIFPYAQIAIIGSWAYRICNFDWPMWGVGLYYMAFDVLFAMLGAKDGVGHFAHIGGVLGGIILCFALRIHRDSESVSISKATLAEVKDHSVLSRLELEDLHKVNPTSTNIVMHWAYKSLHDPRGMSKDCIETFIRMLPEILESEDVRSVGYVIQSLKDDRITVPIMTRIAMRLEKEGDFHGAFSLYDRVMRDPRSQPNDVESAVFRLGMLSESAYQDHGRARQYYEYLIHHWPMGVFSTQAKARLAVVGSA